MRTFVAVLLGFLLFPEASFSQTDDGFVGIFGNASGGEPCITVPPLSSKVVYVIGKLKGASAAGITGVEFRIEVSNPAGWFFTYSPPAGATVTMGDPMDRNPTDPDDGSGINLAFSECQQGQGGKVDLGTILVMNISGGPTDLLVKRHSRPSNAAYACPLFTLCDSPVFSKVCQTPSSDPPCPTLSPSKSMILHADPAVFSVSLATEEATSPGIGLRPAPPPTSPPSSAPSVSVHDEDIVGNMAGYPGAGKATRPPAVIHADTAWVATWTFDGGGGTCSDTGWTKADNRILNDGTSYWYLTDTYAGTWGAATIVGNAAALGVTDACFASPLHAGYGNSWDYAIRIQYRGTTQLEFDAVLDTDGPEDRIQVELDPLCSCNNIDYAANPWARPENCRTKLGSAYDNDAVRIVATLTDFGDPGATHCALIRFVSDLDVSPQDQTENGQGGDWYLGAGVVVDNIQTSGGPGAILIDEDFENWTGDCNPEGTVCLINSGATAPFGEWARVYPHVTDNDACTENASCSWLFTDWIGPTIANDPANYYGPGNFVIKNWLDDVIVSPWVSTAGLTLQDPIKVVLSFREFAGNRYENSKIGRAWAVRGKKGPGCLPSSWTNETHPFYWTWEGLDRFTWETEIRDITPRVDRDWTEIQVRFRVSDLQLHYLTAPTPDFKPGPGPFLDRVRLGRVSFPGPVITGVENQYSQFQAQDAFTTEPDPQFPGAGERFRPSTNRFGTCAFSVGADVYRPAFLPPPGSPPNLKVTPGDSIIVEVTGRSNAEIDFVRWYGAIVAGPHAGKAPAPWTVNPNNGFFEVAPAPVYTEGGSVLGGYWFVDLDDTYFRGGDVLRYLWLAGDFSPAVTSAPPGLSAPPTSVQQAETATGGLLEVNYLPTINWAPAYLARIAADPTGDLEPTSTELLASQQARCILYVNKVSATRRSGTANRTSFMFTLDRLGYQEKYDVYDVMGPGSANNDLASRATVQQAQGYALIVHDTGRGEFLPLTRGLGGNEKTDQATWYQNWLNQGIASERNTATLWLIGEDLVQEASRGLTPDLLSIYAGVTLPTSDQGLTVNPNVTGVGSKTFDNGIASPTAVFAGDQFTLHGGCPSVRDYDGLGVGQPNAVITHKYQHPGTGQIGAGAVVMNTNTFGNWNTVVMAFPWFDIVPFFESLPSTPAEVLAQKILTAVDVCGSGVPTDSPPTTGEGLPLATTLSQNSPNPFNPTTTIGFDLGAAGHVELRIYDVAGNHVRTLVDEELPRKRHSVVWDGLDGRGKRVPSGLYFYRLRAEGFEETRKLVVLR